jgi:hypothetical protein
MTGKEVPLRGVQVQGEMGGDEERKAVKVKDRRRNVFTGCLKNDDGVIVISRSSRLSDTLLMPLPLTTTWDHKFSFCMTKRALLREKGTVCVRNLLCLFSVCTVKSQD